MCNHNIISRNEKNSPAKFQRIMLYIQEMGAFSHQSLYFNATDLKLGSSTYIFLLCPFLVFTKCQALNLRVGRSRDPLLQKVYCD